MVVVVAFDQKIYDLDTVVGNRPRNGPRPSPIMIDDEGDRMWSITGNHRAKPSHSFKVAELKTISSSAEPAPERRGVGLGE